MTHVYTGTTDNYNHRDPAKIYSLTLHNESGGVVDIHVHYYMDTTSKQLLHLNCPNGETNQIVYNGIPFPDGFTVESETGVESYTVEYENYNPKDERRETTGK